MSLITTVLLAVLPSATAFSPYVVWGWRIRFLFGSVISFAFFIYFYRQVRESDVWTKQKTGRKSKKKSPLKLLFGRANRGELVQVFLLMSGIWLGLQAISVATPAVLISYLDQPKQHVTVGELITHVPLWGAYLIFGYLGQRYGRRKILMRSGLLSGLGGGLLYVLSMVAIIHWHIFWLGMVLIGVCLCLTVAPNAIMVAYICERFSTSVRSSGYGVAYTTAVIIPSFYAFMLAGLSQLMPYPYTPTILVIVGGTTMFIAAKMGPETKETDLALRS